MSLCFIPLLPPLKVGEKQCRNAKSTPENHIFHIRKDHTLTNLIDTALELIDKTDTLCSGIGNRSGVFAPDNFTVKYTITRTDSKDILIESLDDHQQLIDEVKQLNRANSGFKLFITELKVFLLTCTED